MTYTVGSLFSGALDGLGMAFALAGFEVLFHVEYDDWRRNVLEKNAPQLWSQAQQFKDVKQVGSHNLPQVDCLVGGFPCQDVSASGRRAGLEDGTRSGLWDEYRRIISELRPRLVLVENVAGLLTLGGTTVIANLAGMGYVGRWGTISAFDAGSPQERDRTFIVAHAQQIGRERGRQLESCSTRDGRPEAQERERHSTQAERHDPYQLGRSGTLIAGNSQPRLGRFANGIPGGVDFPGYPSLPKQKQFDYEPPRTVAGRVKDRKERIAALGDAVVWQCVYPIAVNVKTLFEAQDAQRTESVA